MLQSAGSCPHAPIHTVKAPHLHAPIFMHSQINEKKSEQQIGTCSHQKIDKKYWNGLKTEYGKNYLPTPLSRLRAPNEWNTMLW